MVQYMHGGQRTICGFFPSNIFVLGIIELTWSGLAASAFTYLATLLACYAVILSWFTQHCVCTV